MFKDLFKKKEPEVLTLAKKKEQIKELEQELEQEKEKIKKQEKEQLPKFKETEINEEKEIKIDIGDVILNMREWMQVIAANQLTLNTKIDKILEEIENAKQ